jgi:hypothetical protein
VDGGGDRQRGGRDPTALSARQRLAPLLTSIQDPYLQALCQLAMAWISPVGDFDGALRAASVSLEQLRGQAAYSTRSMTLCLAAFARLAFVAGDPERAALVAGAAEGLRRRVGLRVWPLLRRGEAALLAQVRQALGADRFDQAFAAGSRLIQRHAVAAVRDRRDAGTRAS